MPDTTIAVTRGALAADELAEVRRLLDAVAHVDGRYPLSDHLRLELEQGADGIVTVTSRHGDQLVGFAQVATMPTTSSVEVVVDPAARQDPSIATALLTGALDAVRSAGGGPVQWWALDAGEAERALARAAGLVPERELLQMARGLPTGIDADVVTRPFRPGEDEAAFLVVNNRAFAGHPEQGGWTLDVLRRREREPWFDPAGFRLHERDGRLAAFCWTKVHGAGADAVGEIYVIGVDPEFQGLGLGARMTLAGLDSMSARGLTSAMLHVDAANAAALATYERLGFVVRRVDVAFGAEVVP